MYCSYFPMKNCEHIVNHTCEGTHTDRILLHCCLLAEMVLSVLYQCSILQNVFKYVIVLYDNFISIIQFENNI